MQDSTASYKPPTPLHVLEFSDQIICLEFSPFLWSHDLICIAFSTKLIVGSIRFQEEYEHQTQEVEFEKIQVFPCSSRVHSISWSPESNLRSAPKKVQFAYSTADYLINVYTSNVSDAYTSKVLRGHSNYVNDISFNPKGNFLASGSDDLTCRIWLTENNYEVLCKFYLRSPVVAVKWHHEDPGKVLVGEKSGVITFFNVTTETAIMSLLAATNPLMAVDWAPSNSQFVSAISGNQLVVWDVTNPSNASIEKNGHADGGLHVKFFPMNEQKLVSLGARENCLKVSFLHKPNNPFTVASLKLATGLTFHQHLPYICTGVDTKIYMFRLTV
ncbi:hypothetical protein GE061_006401 [Apolygus lucorum]|uniref:Nucleoporin Nup37 n=1 Tax=Apolygus lucorum TaxID=248454 RepID=A0A8S9WT33_APOLU|nr:hypothetical protein GE061_006401 [Apolygus lucorum]